MSLDDERSDKTLLSYPTKGAGLLSRQARRTLARVLGKLQEGRVELREGDSTTFFGDEQAPKYLCSVVTVHTARFYTRVLLGGSLGAAEAYLDGDWDCSDLVALVRIVARNRVMMDDMEKGWAFLRAPFDRLAHFLRKNTRRMGRRNIAAHYDLDNRFFARFLDPTMTYSSGVFERDDATMEEASIAKLDRVCRKLNLSPEDHVLEIGTGWGSFALHAAQHYGCRVTTTTLSKEQHDYARARFADSGLADRITLLMKDYRELTGCFTHIASIEMIEAVGWEYLRVFFRQCANLLTRDGLMVVQAITIADQQFERYKRSVDFINRYIFPGGCVLSVTAMAEALTRATDMRLVHLEDISSHYARTLHCWREQFQNGLADIRALGFDERFLRMWDYYLAYCEGGFCERAIGDVQIVLARPGWRGDPILLDLPAGGVV